jgi:hypothetical protein
MAFAVQNTSSLTLTYYRGDASPDVTFKIMRNDTIVASSVDGYVFIQIPSAGHLDAGQILRASWKAPTTPAQFPKVHLSPGLYVAQVGYPSFDEAGKYKSLRTSFTVF